MMLLHSAALLGALALAAAQLTFTTLGDWGGQSDYPFTTASQRAVARAMAQQAQPDFLLFVGDNFYEDGVDSDRSERFQKTWIDVYPPTVPAFNASFFVLAGNHDWRPRDGPRAEIEFTKRDPTRRWTFPTNYYKIDGKFATKAGRNVTVDILMIDTVLLAGSWDHNEPQPLAEPELLSLGSEQWQWIENELRQSTADWLLVAGHYPIYSISEHGPTDILVHNLLPLMQRYGASAYFCGHDHNAQFLRVPGVDLVVTGAGHELDQSERHINDVPSGSLRFHYAGDGADDGEGMFTSMTIEDEQVMTTKFIDASGTVRQTMTTKNQRKHK